jgi:hypothetical protein
LGINNKLKGINMKEEMDLMALREESKKDTQSEVVAVYGDGVVAEQKEKEGEEKGDSK